MSGTHRPIPVLMDDDTEDARDHRSTPLVTGLLVIVTGGLGIWVGLPWYGVLILVALCVGTYWLQRDGR